MTALAESLAASVDQYCAQVFERIWVAKRKAQSAIQAAKKRRVGDVGGLADSGPADTDQNDAGDDGIASYPGAFSVAFLVGTIERAKERCSGDVAQVRQTKGSLKLPGLSQESVARDYSDFNELEKALATRPGMTGRIWFGQGLVYDEIYQLLQDISVSASRPERRRKGWKG